MTKFQGKFWSWIGKKLLQEGYLRQASLCFEKASEANISDAELALGLMYWHGHWFPQNNSKAILWFRRAAEHGDPIAEAHLGLASYIGRGTPQNTLDSLSWYKKAAEKGNPMAQYNLALMYENGIGVTADNHRSTELFALAARAGVAEGYTQSPNDANSNSFAKGNPFSNPHNTQLRKTWLASIFQRIGGGLRDWLATPSIIAIVVLLFHSELSIPFWLVMMLCIGVLVLYRHAYNILFKQASRDVGMISIFLRSICLIALQICAWVLVVKFVQ